MVAFYTICFALHLTLLVRYDFIPGISDHHVVVAKVKTENNRSINVEGIKENFFLKKGDYSSISQSSLTTCRFLNVLLRIMTSTNYAGVEKQTARIYEQICSKHKFYQTKKKRRCKTFWVNLRIIRIIKRSRAFNIYTNSKSKNHLKKLSEITREY